MPTGESRVIAKSCDVETKKLNRFCKFAIDTQIEKGIYKPRVYIRDSP